MMSATSTQPFRRPGSPPRTATIRPGPHQVQWWLDLDDGTSIAVRGRGLIGRDPAAGGGPPVAHLVTLADQTHSVSRTHLEFGVDNSGLWVRDLGSTNGSAIAVDGQQTPLEPGRPVSAPPGSTISVAGRPIRARAMNGRAVIGSATLDWGVATRIGATHRHNEDAYGTQAPAFVVADGIGGHAFGELASREAVDALSALGGNAHTNLALLMDCLADARARIGRLPTEGGPPPGTTLSGVIVTHAENEAPCWMVVNVGDSRTYRLIPDGLQQLTTDHCIAQALINRDAARFAAARSWRYGNALTRAIVADTDHRPDISLLPMRRGDRILACSDGLTRELDDRSIAGVLRALSDPLAAADVLVNAAGHAGAHDDVTALVIDAVAIASD